MALRRRPFDEPSVNAAQRRLGLDGWPQHGRNFDVKSSEGGDADDFVRVPKAPDDAGMAHDRERINKRLRELKFEELGIEEQHAGRLYTGPLYVKYNAVLRSLTKQGHLVDKFGDLCHGNYYTTTIHVINSAILKLRA